MALDTTAEQPAPVRTIANALSGWIGRLGWVWVEGQIAQLTRRPNTQTVFLTLRDPVAEVSVTVTCPRRVYDSVEPPVTEGARVVVHAKPSYFVPRGTLSLAADDIRPVGLGELLARIEQRRRLLAAEGLFDRALKRPLPFLPRAVGLVCGRASAAERDVLENARRRWPGVRFRVENTAVQGYDAARQVIEALAQLDRDDDEMDQLHRDLFKVMFGPEWTEGTEAAVDSALLGRYYERYADHAVSVALRTIFIVTGERPGSTPSALR